MKASNFDLLAYFRRIGIEGMAPRADIETVAMLMRGQLFSVPFENLDVQAGKGVSLVPEDIAQKILFEERGGYCYEVNGLFAMALEAIGVAYRFVAARPMFYPARRPRTHMAIVATIEGVAWLCDLGFGSYGIRAPLRLDRPGVAVQQDDDVFMLTREANGEFLLAAQLDGEWVKQYGFDLSPQEWIDFHPANYLNSNHPEAIFVQKTLVVLHRPTGRSILLGDRLKTIEGGRVEVQTIEPDRRAATLAEVFGLRPEVGTRSAG